MGKYDWGSQEGQLTSVAQPQLHINNTKRIKKSQEEMKKAAQHEQRDCENAVNEPRHQQTSAC